MLGLRVNIFIGYGEVVRVCIDILDDKKYIVRPVFLYLL